MWLWFAKALLTHPKNKVLPKRNYMDVGSLIPRHKEEEEAGPGNEAKMWVT